MKIREMLWHLQNLRYVTLLSKSVNQSLSDEKIPSM